MGRVERPLGVSRPGRWAEEAQEVIAEEERPMRAVRRGGVGGMVGEGFWMGRGDLDGVMECCMKL